MKYWWIQTTLKLYLGEVVFIDKDTYKFIWDVHPKIVGKIPLHDFCIQTNIDIRIDGAGFKSIVNGAVAWEMPK